MPTTPIQALPYPSATGVTPDVPRDMKALAEAVEGRVVMRFASIAERDAKIPVGQCIAGMIAWVDADQTYYVWSTRGTTPSWRILWRDTEWINVKLANGFTFNAQPQVRCRGIEVLWRGDVQGAFTTSYTTVAVASELPSWAIPTRSYRDAVSPLAGNNASIAASGLVDSGNGLRITVGSPITTAINLKNLSGYTAD